MTNDANALYKKAIEAATVFASCCEELGNYGVSELALEACFPVINQFLLDDVTNSDARSHTLLQFLKNLNGPNTIKSNWTAHQTSHLEDFLISAVPQLVNKMEAAHIQRVGKLWSFGRNITYSAKSVEEIADSVGLSIQEFKTLNKILVDPQTTEYYQEFFVSQIDMWCHRAAVFHANATKIFEDSMNQSVVNSFRANP